MGALFASSGERPSFSTVGDRLHQALVDNGGRGSVRDIGLLLHEGLTKKLSRRSSVVASFRASRRSGISAREVTGTALKVLRSVSASSAGSEYGGFDDAHSLGTLGEEEDAEEVVVVPVNTSADAASAASAPRKTAKQLWAKARIHMQFIMPLATIYSMRSMSIDENTGQLKRIVDPSTLVEPDVEDDDIDFVNPFDSDDSDLDVDEVSTLDLT